MTHIHPYNLCNFIFTHLVDALIQNVSFVSRVIIEIKKPISIAFNVVCGCLSLHDIKD